MIEETAPTFCSEKCTECGECGEHETIIEIPADTEPVPVPSALSFTREHDVHFPVRWLNGGHLGFWSARARQL
jgi:hypothetical protein